MIRMDIYDELGVRKIINGNATLTQLGGSTMPSHVVAAMAEASRHFVDIDELQDKVGQKIAKLTNNEAGYVSCGAAAGMVLSIAACMTGLDPDKRARLPSTRGMKNEVIVHRHGRPGFDFAVTQTGARLVEIGTQKGTSRRQMEQAISAKTAAILYFYNEATMQGQVPLKEGIIIGKRHGVPVIVDAAAQLPPVENLWKFTRMGADLVLFSGGKGLCGPQSSGLILGRRDLIEACAFNACPRHFIGRPMKVGKEEIVGVLAALEWYLGLDHAKLMDTYEDQVRYLVEEFSGLDGVSARRSFPSEAGQPMPRAEITFDEGKVGVTRDAILTRLWEGTPAISLAPAGERGVFVNPQTLIPGEERIVSARIRDIIGSKGETP